MAVAKRPGKEKPVKIEQRKVRVRTSGKTNSAPGWPNLHRTGPGREKHIKRVKASSLARSPARWGALLFASLDRRALVPRRWIFLLSSN